MDKIETITIAGMEFKSISAEKFRVYEFPDRNVKIDNPLWLHVSKSGGHRILDDKEVSHYIPTGWVHLYWESQASNDGFSF